MTDRAVSTVVDVGLCLLLIAAAVVTVAGVAPPSSDPAAAAAGETVATLGTATATVTYSLDETAERSATPSFPRTEGPGFRRRAFGTLAGLVAEATMTNLSTDGEPISRLGTAYRAAVREALEPLLAGRGWRAQIVGRWRPYAGSDLAAKFSAGPSPPPRADVHVATLTVPSGLAAVDGDTLADSTSEEFDFGDLGDAVARNLVWGLFPPERTRQALVGAYPEPRLTRLRYRRLATRYGATVTGPVLSDEPLPANERLAAAIGDELAADMKRRFGDPVSAAARLDVATVTIVVRTWSP